MFPEAYILDYRLRLKTFHLQSLEYSRVLFDFVVGYKVIRSSSDVPTEPSFTFAEPCRVGYMVFYGLQNL